ncbi:MAG: acetyltransferase [Zetaproteobacteria bacterium CG12_big_fil_rev_8_21_14_0_65_54_13]|nr:MAG: acetyltransferase [Zetaproteobacteria bacterium CG12_big_fil_rev_8_21_14_0_65_54_13]PIX54626.1 MAG: acetyltransferase [Zetaproteobacteria bacterium CG_4_10_14_3_um_filter_54_28]PJA30686.1 MAG: acetyltransferase [Zetaproteobacteria bacterium CG_4_9_14_3_um_filter_54_145]
MNYIDVFNGDADGICALHQLRLAAPCDAQLVTGVKRDIALLQRVSAEAGDQVTVLDISLDKNRHELLRLLAGDVDVHYFDHHFAGILPESERFECHIDTDADTCTSLLVNDYLQGKYLPWAVVAAFGDNLFASARAAAIPMGLSEAQFSQLAHLGTLINYNGYGLTLDDLHVAPDALYREIRPFVDPFAFLAESPAYRLLDEGFATDIAQARQLSAGIEDDAIQVLLLPDAAWTRRVSGVFGNELARSAPNRAHALMTLLPGGDYRVSVRAPLNNKSGADLLCMQFPTGGGRKAAAGINALPADQFDNFVAAFRAAYS